MSTSKPPVSSHPPATAHAAVSRWRDTWSFLSELVHELWRQPISMLAKQAAYSLLYAIPSFLIVIVSLTAFIDKQANAGTSEKLQEFIDERVPAELQPLLSSLVDQAFLKTSQSTAALTALTSLAVAVWGGSGGAGALVYACNLVYDVKDERSWLRRKLLNLALMIIGGIGVTLAFVLFLFGQRIGEWIAGKTDRASLLVDFLTSGRGWSLVLVVGPLLLLYVLGPDVEKSIRWLLPGTLAATLAVAVTLYGLDFILGIWNPGSPFGAAGSVLILLWTLYVMSAIVVVGAIINAVVARHFDRTLKEALLAHPGQRRSDPPGSA
jgi:membrane protein